MTDEIQQPRKDVEDSIKALRQTMTAQTAQFDEIVSVLEMQDARLNLAMRQGFILTVGVFIALISIKRLSAAVEALPAVAQAASNGNPSK